MNCNHLGENIHHRHVVLVQHFALEPIDLVHIPGREHKQKCEGQRQRQGQRGKGAKGDGRACKRVIKSRKGRPSWQHMCEGVVYHSMAQHGMAKRNTREKQAHQRQQHHPAPRHRPRRPTQGTVASWNAMAYIQTPLPPSHPSPSCPLSFPPPWVICTHLVSWLPLSMCRAVGHASLIAINVVTVSKENDPRSTKSPLKR